MSGLAFLVANWKANDRAELDRERALDTAGSLDTASDARFQCQLPLEPVNTARLATLKVERAESQAAASVGIGQYVDKRRRAQIAARHALQAIASGLAARRLVPAASPEAARTMDAAIHAAELQLPESWLPFVVSPVTKLRLKPLSQGPRVRTANLRY